MAFMTFIICSLICCYTLVALFVWFDSLRPINNLSVIKGQVFLGWTSTKLGLMFLIKDTTQWCRWGSNPRPLGLKSSTLLLRHCAPYTLVAYNAKLWTRLIETVLLSTHNICFGCEIRNIFLLRTRNLTPVEALRSQVWHSSNELLPSSP